MINGSEWVATKLSCECDISHMVARVRCHKSELGHNCFWFAAGRLSEECKINEKKQIFAMSLFKRTFLPCCTHRKTINFLIAAVPKKTTDVHFKHAKITESFRIRIIYFISFEISQYLPL